MHQQWIKTTRTEAFTLLELLVTMAIITVLAGLATGAAVNAKKAAKRAQCIRNCRQIAVGIHLYCNDNSDSTPRLGWFLPGASGDGVWRTYRNLVNPYVGVTHPPSIKDEIFRCPSDVFSVGFDPTGPTLEKSSFEVTAAPDFTSFLVNGFNTKTNVRVPGIAGVKLSQIRLPEKTVILGEGSAFVGFSWHFTKRQLLFDRSRNNLAFVDGHVSLQEIFWSGIAQETSSTYYYDPPESFGYQWSNR